MQVTHVDTNSTDNWKTRLENKNKADSQFDQMDNFSTDFRQAITTDKLQFKFEEQYI